MRTKTEIGLLALAVLLILAGLLAVFPVKADPLDNGEYTVRYEQGADGLWRMELSANHVFEIARLGNPFELQMGFACQHEAVNHFYFLLGRLYGFTLAPFPPPPGGC
jgi:hypothetical protein